MQSTNTRSTDGFKGAGLGKPQAAAPTTTYAQKSGDGAPKTGGRKPSFYVKEKRNGKFVTVGGIFENQIQTDNGPIVTQTLSCKEALQPGVFYSVFVNDWDQKNPS